MIDRYYVALQYLWAGDAEVQNYDLPFAQKPLQISVNHPSTVYPGQSVDVNILVRDAFGKPVKEADVTAFSETKKFKNNDRFQVPNFEKFKNRKAFNSFSQVKIKDESISKKLQYEFWKGRLGLDSIEFYQFLYPQKGLFSQTIYSLDSITQIAPYVVNNGELQPVFYIYFNDELKYYYEVETLEPYSFRVDKEVSFIAIRLRNKLVTISKPNVIQNGKLILSLDLNNLPDGVRVDEMSSQLQEQEARKIQRYLMWVRRDETQTKAYIGQGKQFHVFKTNVNQYGRNAELVGPLFPGTVSFRPYPEISFSFKPAMIYTFKPGLIDRETSNIKLTTNLHWRSMNASLRDWVLTEKHIEDYYNATAKEPYINFRKYPTPAVISARQGSLAIRRISKENNEPNRYATFLINLDKPDEYFIYPANENLFNRLSPGMYQLVIIFSDEQYVKPAPVKVSGNGCLFYDISETPVMPADLFSKEIIKTIKEWAGKNTYVEQYRMQEMQNIRQLYYQESSTQNFFGSGRWVTGVVTATEDGSTLPGVNVIVKGTSIGTVTDADGFYRLYVPYESTLVFSFIGFMTDQVDIGSRSQADAQMTMDVMQLSEVVVTAYGVNTEKRALAYSVSNVLQGRMAGITVNGMPGSSDSVTIHIRGMAAMQKEKPLVLIDGVFRNIDEIDPSQIHVIEILKAESAVALYGSRASNGIILISTKPGATRKQLLETKLPPLPDLQSFTDSNTGNSLRKNFRDYAFWQPALRTNKQGIASFRVTYPDDITGWNMHVLAMSDKKRTGQNAFAIQSFKPLVAQLALPSFLIAGDTTIAISKITNYTSATIEVSKRLTMNDTLVSSAQTALSNSEIDSVHLFGSNNHVEVKFQIEYNDYKDGELRTLPVLQAGTKEVNGIFAALPSDTTFTIEPKPGRVLRIYAQADFLDVLLSEINTLKAYPYDCNEQLASKLKAYLAESAVMKLKDKKFDNSKDIEKIVRRLVGNQSKNGSWSWWGMEGGNTWITVHVAEALIWAEQMGFSAQFDKQALKEYLKYPIVDRPHSQEQLSSWILLSDLGEKLDVKSISDSLSKSEYFKDGYIRLLTMRLLQLQGEAIDWTWIESLKRKTMKGNLYWGEQTTTMWNNDINNTLLVYRMKQTRNSNDHELVKIRNYFLEVRKSGWRNTYESSRIIQTLIPASPTTELKHKPELRLSGGVDTVVTSFPFQIQVKDLKSLIISKTGDLPVYFTAYEESWSRNPSEVTGDFSISTSLVGVKY
jgi:alpha-2-macroglobulin